MVNDRLFGMATAAVQVEGGIALIAATVGEVDEWKQEKDRLA